MEWLVKLELISKQIYRTILEYYVFVSKRIGFQFIRDVLFFWISRFLYSHRFRCNQKCLLQLFGFEIKTVKKGCELISEVRQY